MPAKIIMRWDIRPEKDSEYFEFLVHEFIPGLNALGIVEINFFLKYYVFRITFFIYRKFNSNYINL
mgnify:CR=1 FL=1